MHGHNGARGCTPGRAVLLTWATVALGAAGVGGAEGGTYFTSLSHLWRGSTDLRFKTEYSGGTVLDGFICSDLIEIGGYLPVALSSPRLD